MSRIQSLWASVGPALLLTAAIVAGLWIVSVLTAVPAAACADCECYFSSDCVDTGRGKYCDYVGDCVGGSGCTCINKPDTKINNHYICGEPVGKPQCDGVCVDKRSTAVSWNDVTVDQVADAVDLYLDAYISAGLMGGGSPEPGLLAAAQSVPLTPEWRDEVERDVHQIMIVLLARDFLAATADGACARPYGQVPVLEPSAANLLDTVRAAFVQGIRDGDISGVRPAIDGFWASDFWEPLHPHGCYPHGHDNAPDVATCQGNQIEGLLDVVIAGQGPMAVQPSFPVPSSLFGGAGL